jgi:hypothetical protein
MVVEKGESPKLVVADPARRVIVARGAIHTFDLSTWMLLVKQFS